jgi:glycosyltransferase involved in cell wall biosynthesis
MTSLGGIYKKSLNWGARKWVDRIVVDAESILEQFDLDVQKSKDVRVLHNCVDLVKFNPDGKKADLDFHAHNGKNPVLIGQVGRIIPLKGQHVLLEAFSRVAQHVSNVHLVFVGIPLFDSDEYFNRLKKNASELYLSDHVHFLGFYPNLPDFLRAIDIFVHPSTEADSPISVQEAMASSKALIASSVPGTVELFIENKEGLLVNPSDPEDLAESLLLLLGDPIKRKELGVAARVAAERRFGKRMYGSAFGQILEEVHAQK